MDVALVEHPEHDVDGDKRGEDEDGLTRERVFKGCGRALETGAKCGRETEGPLGVLDGLGGLTEGDSGRQVEGNGHGRNLALVVDS